MAIHKEGYTSIALCILFIFVSNALIQIYIPQFTWFTWFFYAFSVLLLAATLWFFRDPSVDIVTDDYAVLSPANGKIISITELDGNGPAKDHYAKIVIATQPGNVHVTRYPVSGTIKEVQIDNGVTIAIAHAAGYGVLYRQLPGFSKHIITYADAGNTVTQGSQAGFSMLGANTEVLLPAGTLVDVDIDDVVKGGQTVLARFKV